METKIIIPLLNETALIGLGYYIDYHKGYRKGKKISARFNIENALDLFENAIPDLIDPCKFQVRINELIIELSEFYTIEESQMVINLFKKSLSLRSSAHFKKVQISFGYDILIIDNLKYWEYLVEDTIFEDLSNVEYIEYFRYKNSYTYVSTFLYSEFNDDGEVIEKFNGVEIMTDQIQDYWDFDIDFNIHFDKLKTSCYTNVELTFVDGQETFDIYMPVDKLSNSTMFKNYILNTQVRSKKRRKSLLRISTDVLYSEEEITEKGGVYSTFIEWYLPCNGEFDFNEDDK
jgi:hypothetical protein